MRAVDLRPGRAAAPGQGRAAARRQRGRPRPLRRAAPRRALEHRTLPALPAHLGDRRRSPCRGGRGARARRRRGVAGASADRGRATRRALGRAADGERLALAARRRAGTGARSGAHQVVASAPARADRGDAERILRAALCRTGADARRAALGRAHRAGRGRGSGQARAGVPRRPARHPVLLADHGARRRHQGPRRGPPAQRAADAGQLRPAQRARRARRPPGAGGGVLQLRQRPRPPLLPQPRAHDRRRGGPAADRSGQPGAGRGAPALGLAGAPRAEAWQADGRRARSGRRSVSPVARSPGAARAVGRPKRGRPSRRFARSSRWAGPRSSAPAGSHPSGSGNRHAARRRRSIRRSTAGASSTARRSSSGIQRGGASTCRG